MPSVERVKSEIQGANPVDTLARQVAVFTYLPQIVNLRQDPGRSVRSPLTPDEQRVINAYEFAGYELSQSFAKSHTPEEVKTFERAHGHYEMDPRFTNNGSTVCSRRHFARDMNAAAHRETLGGDPARVGAT